jgi:hypothetical protein
MTDTNASRVAWALVVWCGYSVALVVINAPSLLRVPFVGTFCLFAVGIAVVVAARIASVPLAIGLAIASGFASLILASMVALYVAEGSAFLTLIIQSVVTCALAAWVIRRERLARLHTDDGLA